MPPQHFWICDARGASCASVAPALANAASALRPSVIARTQAGSLFVSRHRIPEVCDVTGALSCGSAGALRKTGCIPFARPSIVER